MKIFGNLSLRRLAKHSRHGNAEFGPQASALTSLAEPRMDWVAIATGFGVPARRVDRVGTLLRVVGQE